MKLRDLLLISLIVIAILTTSSLAANRTLVQYSDINPTMISWPSNFHHSFDKFDPALGTLNRIDFTATLNATMNGSGYNKNTGAWINFSFARSNASLDVTMLDTSKLNLKVVLRLPNLTGHYNLSPYDGIPWIGPDSFSGNNNGSNASSLSYTQQAALAQYIWSGIGTKKFDLPSSTTGDLYFGGQGGPNIVHNLTSYGWSHAVLTYTYDDSRCLSGYKKDGCTGLPLSGWNITVKNSTN